VGSAARPELAAPDAPGAVAVAPLRAAAPAVVTAGVVADEPLEPVAGSGVEPASLPHAAKPSESSEVPTSARQA